jgi:hypothetical protein
MANKTREERNNFFIAIEHSKIAKFNSNLYFQMSKKKQDDILNVTLF